MFATFIGRTCQVVRQSRLSAEQGQGPKSKVRHERALSLAIKCFELPSSSRHCLHLLSSYLLVGTQGRHEVERLLLKLALNPGMKEPASA